MVESRQSNDFGNSSEFAAMRFAVEFLRTLDWEVEYLNRVTVSQDLVLTACSIGRLKLEWKLLSAPFPSKTPPIG